MGAPHLHLHRPSPRPHNISSALTGSRDRFWSFFLLQLERYGSTSGKYACPYYTQICRGRPRRSHQLARSQEESCSRKSILALLFLVRNAGFYLDVNSPVLQVSLGPPFMYALGYFVFTECRLGEWHTGPRTVISHGEISHKRRFGKFRTQFLFTRICHWAVDLCVCHHYTWMDLTCEFSQGVIRVQSNHISSR